MNEVTITLKWKVNFKQRAKELLNLIRVSWYKLKIILTDNRDAYPQCSKMTEVGIRHQHSVVSGA